MFKIITTVVIFLVLDYDGVEAKLKLLNVVFRHGDRTPDNNGQELYPNDPYRKYSFWPYALGGLTNVGKMREYALGKYLRYHYGSFLGDYYLPETVYARSTNVDRAKMSLQLTLAALFPPKHEQGWNHFLNWQPIPTHYVPVLDDNLMAPEECPKYLYAREKVETSSEFRAELNKLSKAMSYLTKVTGKNITSSNDLYFLYFTLRAEEDLNLKIPRKFINMYPDGPIYDGILLEYKIFSYNDEMKRLNGGMLLRRIISNMVDYINGKINQQRKIFLYSGHETNVAALLQALGFYKPHVPEYSSAVIIELHEENNRHYVKIVYYKGIVEKRTWNLSKKESIDEVKQVRGCESLCLLKKFRTLLLKVTPTDEDVKSDKRSLRRSLEKNKIKVARGIVKQILSAIYEEDQRREELLY